MNDISELFKVIISVLGNKKVETVFFMVLGAMISSFVSYVFNKRSANERLRKELEIGASEAILHQIQLLIDNIDFYNNFCSLLMDYNLCFEETKEQGRGELEKLENELSRRVNSNLEQLNFLDKELRKLLNIFETQKVVFNKLLYLEEDLKEMHGEFNGLLLRTEMDYKFVILPALNKGITFSEKEISDFVEYERRLFRIKTNSVGRFDEIKVEVQNVFLSVLFNYKIQDWRQILK